MEPTQRFFQVSAKQSREDLTGLLQLVCKGRGVHPMITSERDGFYYLIFDHNVVIEYNLGLVLDRLHIAYKKFDRLPGGGTVRPAKPQPKDPVLEVLDALRNLGNSLFESPWRTGTGR